MRNISRKTGMAAAMLGISALVLTACGAAPEAAPSASGSAPTGASDFTGCIVSDSGGFDDRSFNQSSYEGLMQAKTDLGINVKQAESKAETDFGPNLNAMVKGGCDLTVTVGFLLSDETKKVAAANPDKHFAIVDDNAIDAKNVKPIIYDTAQASFLAGYLAAGMTETGKVATYGGLNIPTVSIFMDGYADGVAYYNEKKSTDVKVLGWDVDKQNGTIIGGFDDQGKGKNTTITFANEGADVIMPVAGPVGLGTMDAVKELNASGKNIKVIWVDADGFEALASGNEFVLSSVMKEMGKSVEDVVKSDVEGNFDSTPYVGTLENGGVALAPFHDFDSKVSDELKAELETLKADIISGAVKVESDSSPKTK
ncbi:BMP family ABC transporter substrate-binding protein [Paeniglutamicibacter gangotriensis]|uniref:BMP family ABC transporter substrate-binding protein n=1 Tax=Paeniglutamicibacter gangotriensis TaxID=254787 RepID=A0A5B0E7T4_9MICC|nr:BMP family ABC transporter substrate-binding protein [Paeniglutamicibacter gangotriensis]KAA0973499.1 BMP family ABC transporter substrate-binding protein [Paeniglutamicibacter gangotriensis]